MSPSIRSTGQHVPRRAEREPPPARLPDFLLIGAAKCGTTTLYRYLDAHPALFLATPKEPQFFSDDAVWARGEGWYRSLFAAAAAWQRCGEASTTYTRWPHTPDVARRIASLAPGARLIYIMRHPVERAYSHYAHRMRYGVTMPFECALERHPELVDCGLYARQIERYRRRFTDGQMLLLLLDDLRARPGAVLERGQRFLEVPAVDLLAKGPLLANRTGPDHFIRHRTIDRVRRMPGAAPLIDLVPGSWRRAGYDLLRRSPLGIALRRRYRLAPMLPATRRRLLDLYRRPTEQLEELMHRDLSAWKR